MLSLSDRLARHRSLRMWVTGLMAFIIALAATPMLGTTSSQVMAQGEDDAAADPAPAQDDAPVKQRNFLSWMIDALGWFWLLVFAALSFVMVALIMMNLLQVRRDVLLPNDFVEEFDAERFTFRVNSQTTSEHQVHAQTHQNSMKNKRKDDAS